MINSIFKRIKILKLIDLFLGPALIKIMPAQLQTAPIKNIKQILVIRPGGLGDALLLLPVLKAVSNKNHPIKIDILCEPRNREAFYTAPYVNDIFSYQNLLDLFSIFKKKYDIIIDTEQSHYLSAIITRLLKADLKAGFKTNDRQKMYNLTIPYSHDIYEAEMFWNLIRQTINIDKSFAWDFPYFKPLKINPPPEITPKKYICLFPGASVEERLWPEKRWAEIIDYIVKSGFICIVLGGQKEITQIKKILELCATKRIINLCNKLSIIETNKILEKACMLISIDSGILHLGILSDIPTISLFGPGITDKWGPKGKKHIIINKGLGCSPCTQFGTTPPCPNKNACMLQITPEDVIKNIKEIKLDLKD